MKFFYILTLIILYIGCDLKQDEIFPDCEYQLTDLGNRIDINIYSEKESVLMQVTNSMGDIDSTIIVRDYYNCITIERCCYDMYFEIDNCKQKI